MISGCHAWKQRKPCSKSAIAVVTIILVVPLAWLCGSWSLHFCHAVSFLRVSQAWQLKNKIVCAFQSLDGKPTTFPLSADRVPLWTLSTLFEGRLTADACKAYMWSWKLWDPAGDDSVVPNCKLYPASPKTTDGGWPQQFSTFFWVQESGHILPAGKHVSWQMLVWAEKVFNNLLLLPASCGSLRSGWVMYSQELWLRQQLQRLHFCILASHWR